jgi:two-component system chemotaxis response regulator CheB
MSFEHLVVIGASAGGIEAVKAIVSRVDRDFPAPICAVPDVSPSSPNLLPTIVSRAGAVPAELARSGAALEPSMPRSALQHVEVDHVPPLEEIGPLLNRLVRGSVYERAIRPDAAVSTEVRIAEGGDPMEAGVQKLGTPSMFACPECHGVLSEVSEGPLVRYRCHTGHAYSRATLQAEQNEQVETTLYNAMRALDERLLMLDQLARHEADVANAGHLRDALARAREAAATVRHLIASAELKPEAEPHG